MVMYFYSLIRRYFEAYVNSRNLTPVHINMETFWKQNKMTKNILEEYTMYYQRGVDFKLVHHYQKDIECWTFMS